ncbi:hypothetical protein EDB84DRAFT_1439253 [Lactarius hengduanensis]|nr:hypothetical protein EDB84DRAFT_1439253 [Lactarius hengduanensis]
MAERGKKSPTAVPSLLRGPCTVVAAAQNTLRILLKFRECALTVLHQRRAPAGRCRAGYLRREICQITWVSFAQESYSLPTTSRSVIDPPGILLTRRWPRDEKREAEHESTRGMKEGEKIQTPGSGDSVRLRRRQGRTGIGPGEGARELEKLAQFLGPLSGGEEGGVWDGWRDFLRTVLASGVSSTGKLSIPGSFQFREPQR